MAGTFRKIPSFTSYGVDHVGRIKRLHPGSRGRGHLMKPSFSRKGYLRVHLQRNGRSLPIEVHNLVAEAFYGMRPGGHDIHHKNSIKTDNHFRNLVYILPKQHSRETDRSGARISKLCPGLAHEVRGRHAGGESYDKLAARFRVGKSTIRDVVKRKTWKHVA